MHQSEQDRGQRVAGKTDQQYRALAGHVARPFIQAGERPAVQLVDEPVEHCGEQGEPNKTGEVASPGSEETAARPGLPGPAIQHTAQQHGPKQSVHHAQTDDPRRRPNQLARDPAFQVPVERAGTGDFG